MLDQAIENAEMAIRELKRQGFRMTVYCIRQNIKLVKSNPDKFSDKFISMYSKK